MNEPRCAQVWGRAGVSAAGTAPPASFWVAVEQPGSWGRQAFLQSGLDPDVGSAFQHAISAAGGKAVLVRRPGVSAHRVRERVVMVSGGFLTRPWLAARTATPDDLPGLLERVARLAPSLASAIAPPAGFDPLPGVVLICTNGKRDRCCAIDARPVVEGLTARLPDGLVWESSHLNGHRFAPTGVVLPTAQMFAHLRVEQAQEALEMASVGRLVCQGARRERGRTCLPQMAQAVDIQVRAQLGETDPTALRYDLSDAGGVDLCRVRHRDGREMWFEVTRVEQGCRAESCGKAPVPSFTWVVREHEPV